MAFENVYLTSDEITLGQFLKFADIIDSGGMTKWFLEEHDILVNRQPDKRRGRKLHPGDTVEIAGVGAYKLLREEA
ncbi:MAG: S4 domain-containing protein YaaA [Tumebacillaceae bacterium]|jgi:ribosome-associated protein